MARYDGFDLILGMRPPAEEMTSLVTLLEGWTPMPFSVGTSGSPTVRLDWWIHVGGRIRDQYEDMVLRRSAKKSEPLVFDLRMKPDPVLAFEIQDVLSKLPKELSCRLQVLPKWRSMWSQILPGEWQSSLEPSSEETKVSSWKFGEQLGLSTSEMTAFIDDMNQAGVELEEPPWIFWSRFPAWKLQKLKADRAKRDGSFEFGSLKERLAFLRSLLSPQDERSEARSLAPGQLMLNPTFEFVSESLKAFARVDDRFQIRPITELEAAVLDQVRESFRAKRHDAVGAVAREGRVRPEFVQAAIELLCEDGFLLEAPQSFSGELS